MIRTVPVLAFLVSLVLSAEEAPATPEKLPVTEKLEAFRCGSIEHFYTLGGVCLAGQPSAEDFKAVKAAGLKTVLDLRKKGEIDWDEEAVVKAAGLEYHRLPFKGAAELNDEIFDQARKLLADKDKRPLLVHCNSGNRVGPLWIAHRVLDDGAKFEDALQEAKTAGMQTEAYAEKAKVYIEKSKM